MTARKARGGGSAVRLAGGSGAGRHAGGRRAARGPSAAAGSGGGVMAIRVVLGVLEALAIRASVGVTELAKELGTTKPRVYRHLRTLLEQGYAIQDEGSERYAAGARLIALSRMATLTPDEGLVRLARPTIQQLRDELGLTVNLSLVYGNSVSIVETLQGSTFIGVVMRTHAGMPLHSTAAGKLLLADRVAKGIALPRNLERFTEFTVVNPATLRAELQRVRTQGWASAPEETVLGVNAISAPVRDHRGELVAMISLLGSIQHITRRPARRLTGAIQAAAQELSAALQLQRPA